MATLHELGRPFSDAEGPGLLAGLRFDADNTLADTPMVGLLSSLGGLLDAARERASSSEIPHLVSTAIPSFQRFFWVLSLYFREKRTDADNTLTDTPVVSLLSVLGGLLDDACERASP